MIRKIVIPAAGLGTRLLPITKEIPTEMMPLFLHDKNSEVIVKPIIQVIFEQFFQQGLREYCIIAGRQKRIIQDHFTLDEEFLKNFEKKSKYKQDLKNFYLMLNKSKIFWAEQSEPRGFGDAVKYSESFVGNDDFLVIAGDTLIPKGNKIIKKLMNTKLKGKNDAILLLKEVPDPRRFGVAVINKIKNKTIITNVEEKPKNPKSNFSIVALYRFRPSIFTALQETQNDQKELQLTDAIQKLIDFGGNISAILLNENDSVIDIGTADSYLETTKNFKLIL